MSCLEELVDMVMNVLFYIALVLCLIAATLLGISIVGTLLYL